MWKSQQTAKNAPVMSKVMGSHPCLKTGAFPIRPQCNGSIGYGVDMHSLVDFLGYHYIKRPQWYPGHDLNYRTPQLLSASSL